MTDTHEDKNDSRRGCGPNKRLKVQEVVDLTMEEEDDDGEEVLVVSGAQPYYDDDGEVEVVDAPPSASLMMDETEAAAPEQATDNDQDDVQLVGRRNVQALPHMRPHCTEFPYQPQKQGEIINVDITDKSNNNTTPNARYCPRCYCYVCDVPVPDCQHWPNNHCNATDHSQHWQEQRRRAALAAQRGTVMVRLSNARAFHALVLVAREMNPDHLLFICSKTSGIQIRAMSSDKVTLVELFLPASGLAEWSCSGGSGGSDGEAVYLCVLGPSLTKNPWFKGARKSDRLGFRTIVDEDGDGSRALEFIREHDTKDVPQPLHIKLEDEKNFFFDPAPIPPMVYECEMTMCSGRFRDMLNVFLGIVSSTDNIQVTWQRQESKDVVTFCAERNWVHPGQIKRARFHYWTNPQTNSVVSCNTYSGEVHLNLKYLLSVCKATTVSSLVELNFHEELPSAIRYTIPEWSSGGDDGGLTYFVAPVMPQE